MTQTRYIELYPRTAAPTPFDFEAYNHRAATRFRRKRITDFVQNTAELIVTGLIGAGFCFCIALVITML